MMKFCNKCQADTERYARGQCKPCAKARHAAYYASNGDKVRAGAAAYRKANPEKVKTSYAAWCKANPDKKKASDAAYQAANPEKKKTSYVAWSKANPEKINAHSTAWRKANPEKRKAIVVAWQKVNPEKVKAYSAAWRKANPEAMRISKQNRRARKLAAGGNLSKGLSAKLFELQRGKCACCNKPLGDNYHLDHIMPLALGGANSDNNMQLLRQYCNLQKSAKHPIDFMQARGFLL